MGLEFKNKKILFEEKSHWVKHQGQVSTLGVACVRESVRTRVMGMRSLISFTTCNFPW